MFDTKLQATVTKKPAGGYKVTDESGEAKATLNFDSAGKTQALATEATPRSTTTTKAATSPKSPSKTPATFGADPEELEEAESAA